MKLYQYHHCPYCVRADMVANWRQLPHEKVYLLNDDEQSCFDLIGQKMLPVLQFDDGRAMGESLDIVAEIDRIAPGPQKLDPWQEVSTQQLALSAVNRSVNILLFPRNVRIGLPEFETTGAVAYFTERKQKIIGMSFDEALAQTETAKAEVERALAAMPELAPPAVGAALRMGDVLIYPQLRNLTMVRDIALPDWARNYVNAMAGMTGTETYFDRAI